MKKTFIFAAIAASLFAFNASASDRSYTFVEGGAARTDLNGDYQNSNHAYLKGSYNVVNSGVFFTTDFSRSQIPMTNDHARYNALGVGYKHEVHPNADVYGMYSYTRNHVSAWDMTAKGYKVSVGTRFDMGHQFEGDVSFNHTNGKDLMAHNSLSATGMYKMNETWGGVAGMEVDKYGRLFNLGVRASF